MQFYAHFHHFLLIWAYICGLHFEFICAQKLTKNRRKVNFTPILRCFYPNERTYTDLHMDLRIHFKLGSNVVSDGRAQSLQKINKKWRKRSFYAYFRAFYLIWAYICRITWARMLCTKLTKNWRKLMFSPILSEKPWFERIYAATWMCTKLTKNGTKCTVA